MINNNKAVDSNKKAWNQVVDLHKEHYPEDLIRVLSEKGGYTFDKWQLPVLENLHLSGKKVVHVPCNNGRELISLINLGAESGLGIDIAEKNIEWAQELNRAVGTRCEFIACDIAGIDDKYTEQFDIVLITQGSLIWFPDIDFYLSKCCSMLKPGGQIALFEGHPCLNCYDDNEKDELVFSESYFRKGPVVYRDGLDYYGNTEYEAEPTYEYFYTLTDIFQSLLQCGISITDFKEYPFDILNSFSDAEKEGKLPLAFHLVGVKKATSL